MERRNGPSGLREDDDDDAIETLGPLNESSCEFLNIRGRKIGDNTGDHWSTSFLFQRIAVLDQRFNAYFLNDSFMWDRIPSFFIVFDIFLMQTSFNANHDISTPPPKTDANFFPAAENCV